MLLTDEDWRRLAGICRRFKLDAQPRDYDDYDERVRLCDRIIDAGEE
jgi:hypothetical protein